MIRFTLCCIDGHRFEAWFKSGADFEQQKKNGLLGCPLCDSLHVDKALMAPAVLTQETRQGMPSSSEETPAPSASAGKTAEAAEVVAHLRHLKAKLLENSENVGPRFAAEVRSIHYGEAPERPVHGQTTPHEAQELLDEGIPILPLPVLPEELS